MVLLDEREIETAKVLTRAHLKAILNNTELLLKYMEVAKMTDMYMTICLILYTIKNLEKKEEEDEE